MATPRRSILAANLGRYATPADNAQLGSDREQIMSDVRKFMADAKEAGFDVEGFETNPQDTEDNVKRLIEQLQSKRWDGFVISYLIRCSKDYTPAFEALVNTCRIQAPELKIMFVSTSTDLMDTLRRNFEFPA